MNATKNPFTAAAPAARGVSKGTIAAWVLAVAGLAAAGVMGDLWWQTKKRQERELSHARADLARTGSDLTNAFSMIQTNQDLIRTLTNEVAELRREKEEVGQKAKSLEEEMREQLESRDVTISKLQGKLTVSIVDRVMFDSGEAILKADGATVMQKIADLLAAHPELNIHVVGHTDNVPIRQTQHSRFASNWELSTARALAAVHFLTEKAGVDPRRIGAVGYGEFRPVADNSTPEGRAQNRRIAVTILPQELAVADAPPVARAEVLTNGIPLNTTPLAPAESASH